MFGLLIAVAGCRDDTKLEGEPVKLAADGRTVDLQLGDCRVYRVEHGWFGAVRKTRVLSTEFYLGFTVCTRQSLRKDGDYAIATLCRQAIGAGGGCAASGTYRSRDGAVWEKQLDDGTWKSVADAAHDEAVDQADDKQARKIPEAAHDRAAHPA